MKKEGTMAFAQAIFEECWPCWQQHFSPEVRLRLGGVRLSGLADGTPEMASKYLSPDELNRWSGFSQKKDAPNGWADDWPPNGRLRNFWARPRWTGKAW